MFVVCIYTEKKQTNTNLEIIICIFISTKRLLEILFYLDRVWCPTILITDNAPEIENGFHSAFE